MIPTASPAYLHNVYGEFVESCCQQDQFLRGARGAGDGAQVLTEDPRHQCQLFFAADRAHDRALFPVKLRGAQQVRVRVAHLGHPGPTGVDLGQQGPAPERVVHYLSLQSHGDQSTSMTSTARHDRVYRRLQLCDHSLRSSLW